MIIAILASRASAHATEENYQWLKAVLDEMQPTELHHGGEGCAMFLTERYNRETRVPTVAHVPQWRKYGAAAGPIRGKEMVTAAEMCVALWDGKSPGTAHELKEARRQKKRVRLLAL